jgi:hypothetical protein
MAVQQEYHVLFVTGYRAELDRRGRQVEGSCQTLRGRGSRGPEVLALQEGASQAGGEVGLPACVGLAA